jgi:hypothetical protein
VVEPIPNYFPRLIEPDVFNAVQRQFEENRCERKDGGLTGRGGRVGRAKNLLTHLVVCPYCGGPMAFVDRGRPGQYLICDRGRRRVGCARHSIRYEECERLILDNCPNLRPDQVLPNPDEQAALCRSLRERLRGEEAELRKIEQQTDNLVDQITETRDREMRLKRQKQDVAASFQVFNLP